MFKHLRIKDKKALEKCDLLNLGRINIICGPNNSGKSTLLEGIESTSNRFPGITIEQSHINNFFENTHGTHGGDDGLHQDDQKIYKEMLEAVFNTRNVWFLSNE